MIKLSEYENIQIGIELLKSLTLHATKIEINEANWPFTLKDDEKHLESMLEICKVDTFETDTVTDNIFSNTSR